MRTAIYCRVSTSDKGQDTENQALQLRSFAASQGWVITEEYVDEASGAKADRAAFKRLFDDASQRKFDIVLFWSLDRFSREGALETLQYLQRLTDYGIGFRSFTESYLDSCGLFKDAIISILAVLAKQERLRLKERVIAGIARHRKDVQTGKVSTRSGKNLSIGRPKAIFDRSQVVELRLAGKTLEEIAGLLAISRGTVANTLASFQKPSPPNASIGIAAQAPC